MSIILLIFVLFIFLIHRSVIHGTRTVFALVLLFSYGFWPRYASSWLYFAFAVSGTDIFLYLNSESEGSTSTHRDTIPSYPKQVS